MWPWWEINPGWDGPGFSQFFGNDALNPVLATAGMPTHPTVMKPLGCLDQEGSARLVAGSIVSGGGKAELLHAAVQVGCHGEESLRPFLQRSGL